MSISERMAGLGSALGRDKELRLADAMGVSPSVLRLSQEEAGLLADICAHPDEDGPRLIYADWLEDHAAL